MQWTEWQAIESPTSFSRETLAETLDGGQAFRWNFVEEENCWQGVWGQSLARLRLSNDSKTLDACVPRDRANWDGIKTYLLSEYDWDGVIDCLPWRSDPHLKRCIDSFSGLRLVDQPFSETLLAFLCSATKQIPQIKILCERLAEAFGSDIIGDIKALPTWEQLSEASENALRIIGLGFRAKNIKKTADLIANAPGVLDEIEKLSYEEAKTALLEFPGVGEKIADCALLFGARMYEAFPVDTWISKTLAKRYSLENWSPGQLAQFGRIHFGEYAGYAQQFLFSWERAQ